MCSLIIAEVFPEDSGKFTCTVTIAGVSNSTQMYLRVEGQCPHQVFRCLVQNVGVQQKTRFRASANGWHLALSRLFILSMLLTRNPVSVSVFLELILTVYFLSAAAPVPPAPPVVSPRPQEVKPTFVQSLTNQPLQFGATAYFECKVRGKPQLRDESV